MAAFEKTAHGDGEIAIYGDSDKGDGLKGVSRAEESYAKDPVGDGENHAGVEGRNDNQQTPGPGVYGWSQGTGVYGESLKTNGVYGRSTTGTGVYGWSDKGTGIRGESNDYRGLDGHSLNNTGVCGSTGSPVEKVSPPGRYGVFGQDLSELPGFMTGIGTTAGVVGESRWWGVIGTALGPKPDTPAGDRGGPPSGTGVYGEDQSSIVGGFGVFGKSSHGIGVYGWGQPGGRFNGGLQVDGPSFFSGEFRVMGTGYFEKLEVENLEVGGVKVGGDAPINANNSDLYFTKTDHRYTGAGNALGHAAIENDGGDYNSLMILGRTVSTDPFKRVVSLWDDVNVSGNLLVAGDVLLPNSDCAEDFEVVAAVGVEPGTVMVLNDDGQLEQGTRPYDKRVTGVVSGAGDLKPGLVLGRQPGQTNRLPIALIGKVYCKVDATYEPIEVGDLLTTSPTPGHAMKASDPTKAFGAVIGKALQSLASGQGLVRIIVALQ